MPIAALAILVFLFAGVIKGVIGLGLPTISLGILSLFAPPHTAIALVVFPLLLSNIWQIFRTGAGLDTLRRYGVLAGCLFVTLWLTTFVTARLSADLLIGVIGLAMFIFAVTSLWGPNFTIPDRADRIAQVIAGVAAGALGGLTSIWSPPFVTYLIARKVESEEFMRASGVFILIGGFPLMIGFWQNGLLNGQTAPLSLILVLPTIAGFSIGEIIRRRLDAQRFRRVLLWFFLLMSFNLMRRAVVSFL